MKPSRNNNQANTVYTRRNIYWYQDKEPFDKLRVSGAEKQEESDLSVPLTLSLSKGF
jgi:hypothetical protein